MGTPPRIALGGLNTTYEIGDGGTRGSVLGMWAPTWGELGVTIGMIDEGGG